MITLLGATSFAVISFVQNSESIFNFSSMRVNNSPLPAWDLLGSLYAVNVWQSKLTVDLSNGDQGVQLLLAVWAHYCEGPSVTGSRQARSTARPS